MYYNVNVFRRDNSSWLKESWEISGRKHLTIISFLRKAMGLSSLLQVKHWQRLAREVVCALETPKVVGVLSTCWRCGCSVHYRGASGSLPTQTILCFYTNSWALPREIHLKRIVFSKIYKEGLNSAPPIGFQLSHRFNKFELNASAS